MFDIYPPPPHDPNSFMDIFSGKKPDPSWLAEGIEHLPFSEIIFWSRRILSETIRKDSQYTMSAFHAANPSITRQQDPLKLFKLFSEWKERQPPEGDLITPFGNRMFRWFEKPTVCKQFQLAYATIGWYLVNKSKEYARLMAQGTMFLDIDWENIFRLRSSMAQIDAALYRMEVHNAGVWELEPDMADHFCWIDLLFVFAYLEKKDFTPYHKAWDKVSSRHSTHWWYASEYDVPFHLSDELDFYLDEKQVLRLVIDDVILTVPLL